METNSNMPDPNLDFLPKPQRSGGYKAPEGYFNQMQLAVVTELHQIGAFDTTKKNTSSTGNFWASILNALSIKPILATLIIVLCLGSGWYFFKGQSSSQQEFALNDAEIQSYIMSHTDEFDDELVFKMTEKLNLNPSINADWLEDQPITDPYLLDQFEDLDEQSLDALIL